MSEPKILVLFSGGMDSLWLLASAAKHYSANHIYTLHFQYGQKTQAQELKSFQQCCDFYQIEDTHRRVVPLNFLTQLVRSSLTSQDIPVNTKGIDLTSAQLPTSYVPFRNTLFLSIALAWAESEEIPSLSIGAVSEDGHGYPDCRPEYYRCFNELIKGGSRTGSIKIETPLIHSTKDKILKDLVQWKAPVELTWSCYQSNDKACGKCDSCLLRLQAFKAIHQDDKIPYQS